VKVLVECKVEGVARRTTSGTPPWRCRSTRLSASASAAPRGSARAPLARQPRLDKDKDGVGTERVGSGPNYG